MDLIVGTFVKVILDKTFVLYSLESPNTFSIELLRTWRIVRSLRCINFVRRSNWSTLVECAAISTGLLLTTSSLTSETFLEPSVRWSPNFDHLAGSPINLNLILLPASTSLRLALPPSSLQPVLCGYSVPDCLSTHRARQHNA